MPKVYMVKEIFYTLQGEGMHAGRPAVFCRFAGCNLWNGLERDREAAVCKFCDTDFRGGTKYLLDDLAQAIVEKWPAGKLSPYVVCTGGEPLLQLDADLIAALHELGFQVAVETNGTQDPPAGLDWICVSPKADAELKLQSGNELKLVYPQQGISPEDLAGLDFGTFLLQPMDGDARQENTQATLDYCLIHPHWRFSLQTHKLMGIA